MTPEKQAVVFRQMMSIFLREHTLLNAEKREAIISRVEQMHKDKKDPLAAMKWLESELGRPAVTRLGHLLMTRGAALLEKEDG